MSRFLSRAGTNIEDLERQLARVGSNENDTSGDEALAASASGSKAPVASSPATEATPLTGPPNKYKHARMQGTRRLAAAGSSGDSHVRAQAPRKLGTKDGVFMPVCLSIWGILVYVRMGYFLSQIGIAGTVLSFLCGYLVTTMTTLSISAISTNGTVKGGGPYYMLSRSLGPEFGGSIGLMFYAGTLLSAVLNTVAFVEPLLNNFGQERGDLVHVFPEGANWHILYSTILFSLCTVVCLTGAQMFAKASGFLSMFIIGSTGMILLSFGLKQPFEDREKAVFYTGWSLDTFRENLWPDLAPIAEGRPAETFGTVLGVLFPACIGIMAGASMSSSLRKPSKSIPKGTLWGLLLTFVMYMAIVLALGATTRRQTLRDNFNVLQEINIVPIVVPIGAIITSVTSTLSGVLSSASVLQAIAKDDLFVVLKPLKQAGEPTRAILMTYVIAQMSFFVGDTNAVAPYTTTFNLLMFGAINLACLVLKLAGSVNFRPTFHYFKAWTAALGCIGCFAVMGVVDILSALISTGVVVVLFLHVHYTCTPKPWGDVTQSLIYHQCRKFMLRLDARKDHVKFWRPQILLLVHNPRNSLQLVHFCNALKKGGLYIIGHVIKGRFHEMLPEFRRQESAWLRLVDILRVKAFVNLSIDDEEDRGARGIAFGAGLGGMRPNIVVMGFLNLKQQQQQQSQLMQQVGVGQLPTDEIQLNSPISPVAYVRIIEDVMAMGKAVGIAHGFSKLQIASQPEHPSRDSLSSETLLPLCSPSDKGGQSAKQYIDLWPIQIGLSAASKDGSAYLTNFDSYVMVLQLGTVLHLVPYWSQHFILRVMCFVEDERDVAEEHRRVLKLLRDLRIEAELHVHHLKGAGLASYEQAAQNRDLPANAHPVATSSKAVGVPMAPRSQDSVEQSMTPTGFSMRVNLPMPLRYETHAAHVCRNDSSSSSSSSESSDSESDGESSTEYLAGGGSRRERVANQLRLGGLVRQARNLVDANPRRRSDGSMVLTDFYTRVLGKGRRSYQPPSAEQSDATAEIPRSRMEFNDMPVKTQNRILNELVRRHSSSDSTKLIFTTLQAPEPGTSDTETKALEYLEEIDTLAKDLPPVFLVHATSLTITTSL
ncbi:hypothetical protein GGF46_004731 [Coemansia sp. RSA 552]|nr:hypothetical protein GGF46_004731 [Coemansia sp. RSA 552]